MSVKTSIQDLAMTELVASHATIRAIASILEEQHAEKRVVRHLSAALASAEISLETLANGKDLETKKAEIVALPGPLHEEPKAEQAKTKTRRKYLPGHLKVPHVCAGKSLGCTKVIYGNAYKVHENACKFLKAGRDAEKKAAKTSAAKKAGSKKKKAAA